LSSELTGDSMESISLISKASPVFSRQNFRGADQVSSRCATDAILAGTQNMQAIRKVRPQSHIGIRFADLSRSWIAECA